MLNEHTLQQLRALRLDGGQPLDQAMLDTDSGAWVNTSTGAA